MITRKLREFAKALREAVNDNKSIEEIFKLKNEIYQLYIKC